MLEVNERMLRRTSRRLPVMLTVFETTDPDKSPPPLATRVRLVLLPGQIAGLDSEEGPSLNFTCGERGTTLFVDSGERERLVNFQAPIDIPIMSQAIRPRPRQAGM